MKLARAALTAGCLALFLLLVAGPGSRIGVWGWKTALLLVAGAFLLGAATIVLALVAASVARPLKPRAPILLVAILAGGAACLLPGSWILKARGVPPIHDVTTDLEDPPGFVAVLPLRASAPNSAVYGGPDVAAAQRRGYPDLHGLDLPIAPAQAFDQALAAARQMGWNIVAADSGAGRIEATATTTWFGFKDDVVVRVRPTSGGSRVDVRSVSRVGESDIGTNARRIRAYLGKLRG